MLRVWAEVGAVAAVPAMVRTRAGLLRLGVLDQAGHPLHPGRTQGLGIQRQRAGQHLVEDHPQRIDVGAGVHVQPAGHRLFGGHVLGRADHRPGLRKQRVLRKRLVDRLGDPEVDHLGHRLAVYQLHQHVRRLEIAMDDPLLMRVLDRLADRDEQFESLAD